MKFYSHESEKKLNIHHNTNLQCRCDSSLRTISEKKKRKLFLVALGFLLNSACPIAGERSGRWTKDIFSSSVVHRGSSDLSTRQRSYDDSSNGDSRYLNPLHYDNKDYDSNEPNDFDKFLQDGYKADSGSLTRTIRSFTSRCLNDIDPARLGKIIATSCQIGIITYLGYEIWKIIRELANEFNSLTTTDDYISTSSSLIKRSEDVKDIVEFFRQDPDVIIRSVSSVINQKDKSSSNNNNYNRSTKIKQSTGETTVPVPPIPIVILVQKLLDAGVPLRDTTSDDTTDEAPPLPSVESLLLQLTKEEANFLLKCIWTPPDDDDDEDLWMHVVGLDSIKDRLKGALYTIQASQRNSAVSKKYEQYSSLFKSVGTKHKAETTGVLLYGPPGCGKTMLVKALAATSKLPCLVVSPSLLLSKYVGDTNLMVRRLFSLASKLAPCIVCIDELDGLFRERSDTEHDVSRELKTEFLQCWDGMAGSQSNKHPILFIGATNRPFDVDSAVLRRMPHSHYVSLPDYSTRIHLLTQLLSNVPTEQDNLHIEEIAAATEGYSPSDIRQVLQTAALTGPMKDTSQSRRLTGEDIQQALQVVSATPMSDSYRFKLSNFARLQSGGKHQTATPSFLGSSPNGNQPANKWETSFGNFYNIGTIELDDITFDAISKIVEEIDYDESDYDNDNDDNENFDYDDD